MSRQDKATTDRHARILRDLVKQPDNKNCADCRKNDARWASWNLGVYVCIRCSGIHRSMGTHISKVKSIDLDIWTPEQMENIQKWGNKRANLYWEKHLKVGHVPPDHKIESFIRSKYESRRWAMEGPLPSDPSVLENGGSSSSAASQHAPTPTTSAPPAAPASLPRTHPLLSRSTAQPKPTPPAPAPIVDLFGDDAPSFTSPVTTTAPPARSTSSAHAAPGATATAFPAVSTPGPTAVSPGTAAASQPQQSQQAQQKQQQQQQQSNIFDLDFRTPTPTSASSKPQTAKADIMSLFSTASPMVSPPIQSQAPAPVQNSYASWQGAITSSAPPQPQQTQNQAQIGAGGWGMGTAAEQNAWGGNNASTGANAAAAGANGSGMNANPWGGSGFGGASAASGANVGMGAGVTSMGGMGMGMGADPWASPATTNQSQGAAGGYGGFGAASGGGVSAAQKKAEHDLFANIWQ